MTGSDTRSARLAAWARLLLRFAAVALVIVLADAGASWLVTRLNIQIWPEYLDVLDRAVLIAVLSYVVLMATPFVPGIEIGLALMMALGPRGVLIIYLCTLLALTISFGIGRLLPARLLVALLRWLGLGRAAGLVARFDAVPASERLQFLVHSSPERMRPLLAKGRYVLLALLLNLPGNALIGGAGGIAIMAGMSRLYPLPTFVALLTVAILPGPILVLLRELL